MAQTKTTIKRTCECQNCGNEAEMVITCTLDPEHQHDNKSPDKAEAKQKVKGTATCSHCGNEADMWIDIE
ncbi:MAG: hypothetical protein JEZ11_14305 [Desulfobacterales bacterium]|nr:hypothetical protein [Desulfobacterales bacterium]